VVGRITLVISLLVLPPVSFSQSEQEKASAAIQGVITVEYGEKAPFPGHACRKFKGRNEIVYLFTHVGSREIREKMKQLDEAVQTESSKPSAAKWSQVIDLAEALYELIRITEPLGKTTTDEEGRFAFSNLEVGGEYFLLATDAAEPREDGVSYFLDESVGPLARGTTRIHLIDFVGKQPCKSGTSEVGGP
jgi:hypothetical protein